MKTTKEVNSKRIPKYSRYEMLENGVVRNATTFTELKKEEKEGGLILVRLMSDLGKREWVNANDLHKQLFQPDIENKTKEGAKPQKPLELSKSQKIWLLSKEGKNIDEIANADKSFDLGHIRNTLKDYGSNPGKQQKAELVQKMILEQAKVAKKKKE